MLQSILKEHLRKDWINLFNQEKSNFTIWKDKRWPKLLLQLIKGLHSHFTIKDEDEESQNIREVDIDQIQQNESIAC